MIKITFTYATRFSTHINLPQSGKTTSVQYYTQPRYTQKSIRLN